MNFGPAQPPRTGARILASVVFGRGADSTPAELFGWYRAEGEFGWTKDDVSVLGLQAEASGDCILTWVAEPFVVPERLPFQQLSILVGGEVVFQDSLQDGSIRGCWIPKRLLSPGRPVQITFVHPDAARPADVSGVADSRRIAFAFRRVELIEMPATLPWLDQEGSKDLPDRDLMLRFESLGQNCEFGLVQRRCGAEPIGLLRFSGIFMPQLLDGLSSRFDGVADPAMIELRPGHGGPAPEIMLYHRRYDLAQHTFRTVEESDLGDLRSELCVKLDFARRTFIERLEEGQTIYVRKFNEAVSEWEMFPLFAALNRFAPNTLLWVVTADAGHPAGTVEMVHPGFLKGYVDRFAPGEDASDLSLTAWVAVARNAYALRVAASLGEIGGSATICPSALHNRRILGIRRAPEPSVPLAEGIATEMSVTHILKHRLWSRYGAQAYPAEWDGNVYGGGKISQRLWEYLIAVEMLDLRCGDFVLDIGGGSPATGLGFFPRLLASVGVNVTVLDEQFGGTEPVPVENIAIERGLADHESLSALLNRQFFSHISCISVLEHATHEQQRGVFEAVERSFKGDIAVFTFEFHESECHFEQQLTTASLSNAVSGLKRFYLDRIERAPLHCVNALSGQNRLWFPLALRFKRGSPPPAEF